MRAAQVAAERSNREALATDGALRLSSFRELELELFGVFVDLLGSALSAPCDESGRRSTRSTDGHVLVEIGGKDGHAAAHLATITTTTGRLTVPDFTVTITVIGGALREATIGSTTESVAASGGAA